LYYVFQFPYIFFVGRKA